MGLYDNIRTSENLARQSFPSFLSYPSSLSAITLATLLPQNQQPSWQKGILNKNSNINQNYSDFNVKNGFDHSKAIRDRYKPEIIEENIIESLPTKTDGQKRGSGIMQSQATSSILGAVSGITGSIASGLSDNDETQNAVREGVRGTIAQFGPWGAAIAAASGVVDTVGAMTGLDLSNLDQDAADRAGLGGSAKFQYAMNMLPGNSAAWGWMSKAIHGGDTIEGHISDQTKQLSGAFSGSVADVDAATKLGGKNIMFGFNKANKFIQEQNAVNEKLTRLFDETNARKIAMSTTAADVAQQSHNRYGGVSNQQFAIGKEGMKLPELNWARETLLKFKEGGKIQQDIPEFQKGGKLGLDTNVIVEGSYHAHKNHLDEINPELQDITPKGIPVIAHDETGNPQQIAEIERKELILTKELTDKIEALYHDGSEEAMIEAGMLFANELFNNTEDNTGEVLNE